MREKAPLKLKRQQINFRSNLLFKFECFGIASCWRQLNLDCLILNVHAYFGYIEFYGTCPFLHWLLSTISIAPKAFVQICVCPINNCVHARGVSYDLAENFHCNKKRQNPCPWLKVDSSHLQVTSNSCNFCLGCREMVLYLPHLFPSGRKTVDSYRAGC